MERWFEELSSEFNIYVAQVEETYRSWDNYPSIDGKNLDGGELIVKAYVCLLEKAEKALADFLHERLIAAGGAFPTRFAVLNVLFSLWIDKDIEKQWDVLAKREWLYSQLESAIKFDNGALQSAKQIRWEILNYGAIFDLQVSARLYERLRDMGEIDSATYRALLGQMSLWSVIQRRVAPDLDSLLLWWAPTLDESLELRAELMLMWSLQSEDVYSEEDLGRLEETAFNWATAFQTMAAPHSSYIAALAKCHSLLGEHGKAAEQYEHLIKEGVNLDGAQILLTSEDVRLKIFRNVVDCHRKAGNMERAIFLNERCAGEFPHSKGIWKTMADLYHSLSPFDTTKAIECWRKEQEIDPTFGEDSLVSTAIMLAEVGGDYRAALQKHAASNAAAVRSATFLITRHWRHFRSLDETQRTEWSAAADFISNPGDYGILSRRIAGIFSETAEAQLKKLFERFRDDEGIKIVGPMPLNQKKDVLTRFLESGNITLGEMIHAINPARLYSPSPYVEFGAWLTTHAAGLTQRWNQRRATRLNELRRAASHWSRPLSKDEVVELYDLSVGMISLLATAQ